MFVHEESFAGAVLAFTDADLDLGREPGDHGEPARRQLADHLGARRLVPMRQVHGREVHEVHDTTDPWPQADALVTSARGIALLVRVADCTPVVLVDEDRARVGVVHAGREGLVSGVVPAAVDAMAAGEPTRLHAWVGPRACGRCYELPEDMADAVEAAVPGTRSTTDRGTPAVDVGAGVVAQLQRAGVTVHDIGAQACSIEDDRLASHRRDGDRAGRMGAVVMLP